MVSTASTETVSREPFFFSDVTPPLFMNESISLSRDPCKKNRRKKSSRHYTAQWPCVL